MFLSTEQNEQQYWNDWRFHSHRWEEWEKSKFQCTWCSLIYSEVADDKNKIEMCRNNPMTSPKVKVDTAFY